jgi:fructose-specific component phosphotransferase system IIB-like protein
VVKTAVYLVTDGAVVNARLGLVVELVAAAATRATLQYVEPVAAAVRRTLNRLLEILT